VNNTFILWRWVGALLLLPINVLIIIPAIFLDLNAPEFNNWTSWLAVVTGFLGLALVVSCVRLFAKSGGDGTPAPWDPVANLIITGPYRYVRNPMLSGVIIILFSEALVFWSLSFFIYTTLFVLLNMAYFPLVEEPGLIKRYGAAYKIYMNNVPRWIPLIKPYNSEDL
jgi:protein-S-isoprenylcysteine O-methyltransferase Ste14